MDKRPNYHGSECFHCGADAVYWTGDFDFSDFDYEGDGIVQMCKCYNCGAEIEYIIPSRRERDESDSGD